MEIDPRALQFQLQSSKHKFCTTTKLIGGIHHFCYQAGHFRVERLKEDDNSISGEVLMPDMVAEKTPSQYHAKVFVSEVAPFYQIDFDVLIHQAIHGQCSIQVGITYSDLEISLNIQRGQVNSACLNFSVEMKFVDGQVKVIPIGQIEAIREPYHCCCLINGTNKMVIFISSQAVLIETFEVELEQANFYQKKYITNHEGNVSIGMELFEGEQCELKNILVAQSCGVGQADPRILHYQDGEPIIEDGRIFVGMTSRGLEDIQNIYSMNLRGEDWKLEGQLLFDLGETTSSYRNYTAADVMFNQFDKKWYVFPVSHIDDHQLYVGFSRTDIRYGVTIVKIKLLDYPHSGNDEDFYCFFDQKIHRWRAVYCKATPEGYHLGLLEAEAIDGCWKIVRYKQVTSFTGPMIKKIGNKHYIFTGHGVDVLEILNYPTLEKIGEIDYNGKTKSINIWPAIFPLKIGSKLSYAMLTFDRVAPLGGWSYGGNYFYESQFFDE